MSLRNASVASVAEAARADVRMRFAPVRIASSSASLKLGAASKARWKVTGRGRASSTSSRGALDVDGVVVSQQASDDALHVFSAHRGKFLFHLCELSPVVNKISGSRPEHHMDRNANGRTNTANQRDSWRYASKLETFAKFQAMRAGALRGNGAFERSNGNLQENFFLHRRFSQTMAAAAKRRSAR